MEKEVNKMMKTLEDNKLCSEFSDDERRKLVRFLIEWENTKESLNEKEAEANKKETITLRLSVRTIKKARSFGKGYTKLLSDILENALDDSKMIMQNLR